MVHPRFFVAAFLLSSTLLYGQVDYKYIVQTWFPVNVTDFSGNTIDSDLYNGIITFKSNGEFTMKNIGKLGVDQYYYEFEKNNMVYVEGLGKFQIIFLNKEELKIVYGAQNTVVYRPLHMIMETQSLENRLNGQHWFFTILDVATEVHFLDTLVNSGGIRKGFEHVKSCIIRESSSNSYEATDCLWHVEAYQGYPILSVQKMDGNNFLRNFYISSHNSDTITTSTWYGGKKYPVEMISRKPENNDSIAAKVRILTERVWKLNRYELAPSLQAQAYSDYFIKVDTALILTENDFDKQRIQYKFDDNGHFTMIKGANVIKQGRWRLTEKGTVIILRSDYNSEYYEVPDSPMKIHQLNDTHLIVEKIEEFHRGKKSFEKISSIQYFR